MEFARPQATKVFESRRQETLARLLVVGVVDRLHRRAGLGLDQPPLHQAAPSAGADPFGLGVPPRARRAPLQAPVQGTGAPLVEECREQQDDEETCADVSAPTDVVERHGPRDDEDRLEVEDDEEDGNQVELDGQPHLLGFAHRHDAGLERERTCATVSGLGTDDPRGAQRHRDDAGHHDGVKEKRQDVGSDRSVLRHPRLPTRSLSRHAPANLRACGKSRPYRSGQSWATSNQGGVAANAGGSKPSHCLQGAAGLRIVTVTCGMVTPLDGPTCQGRSRTVRCAPSGWECPVARYMALARRFEATAVSTGRCVATIPWLPPPAGLRSRIRGFASLYV